MLRWDTSSYRWADHTLAAQAVMAQFVATFLEYSPRQKAASFTIDDALAKMSEAVSRAGH